MGAIVCHYCYKPIRDRDELITASSWFRVKSFHYVCFQKVEEETTSRRSMWTPLNGVPGTISVVVMTALSFWMLLTNTLNQLGDLIGILAIYPLLLRIVSIFKYEIHLPKFVPNKKDIHRND
ncbi:hypothetical protein [Salirhabdus salicampi]|uniref:hypothetical protein n=1 Tax=Salirhabdus salicampi TaxID=476102 RepID=UPI0020C396A4|nr:hypothetical protein [Salirhabdus salicampi]MCP8615312.1 hypothetical protein [Salirhabdus salicampi]